MARIFPFGTAPAAKSEGYRMVGTEEGTEQSIFEEWVDSDLIFVKGAMLFGRPGHYEFARYERTVTGNSTPFQTGIPPNSGSAMVTMLLTAAAESMEGLRDRISNVHDAPLAMVWERRYECFYFDVDGQTYLGELRGRNRDLCINPNDRDSQANKAIALRVLLDRDANPVIPGHTTVPTSAPSDQADIDLHTQCMLY